MPNNPFTRPECRYELSVTVGHITVTQACPTLEAAQGAFATFKAREANNRDAHGGIYDRETRSYGDTLWRGGPKRNPLPTIVDTFAKLIARGDAVSVIGGGRTVHFGAVERERAA